MCFPNKKSPCGERKAQLQRGSTTSSAPEPSIPESPFRANGAERDIRARVALARCLEAMKTCARHDVSFRNYLSSCSRTSPCAAPQPGDCGNCMIY